MLVHLAHETTDNIGVIGVFFLVFDGGVGHTAGSRDFFGVGKVVFDRRHVDTQRRPRAADGVVAQPPLCLVVGVHGGCSFHLAMGQDMQQTNRVRAPWHRHTGLGTGGLGATDTPGGALLFQVRVVHRVRVVLQHPPDRAAQGIHEHAHVVPVPVFDFQHFSWVHFVVPGQFQMLPEPILHLLQSRVLFWKAGLNHHDLLHAGGRRFDQFRVHNPFVGPIFSRFR